MSVTVTRTAGATISSERWTNFSYSFLQYLDSSHATCSLGANDSSKWGNGYDFKFSIPLDATVIGVHLAAYWWGSHAGSYINLQIPGLVSAYDEGEVAGGWVSAGLGSGVPTPAQVNDPGYLVTSVTVGRTTGAAVNVMIDRIEVSVTYEPYVAPPAPLTGVPTVINTANNNGLTSTTALLEGYVTDDGGATVFDRGFCVAGTPNPRTKTVSAGGTGLGAFVAAVTGLAPSTVYHNVAYAQNANGFGFSTDDSFTTAPQKAGDGGIGLVSSLSGQSAGYSGGGGGGMFETGAAGGASLGGGPGKCYAQGNGWPGTINTGGGGGGAGAYAAGGAGGKGVVVIRYLTADAIATSPSLGTSIFRPSLAYRGGRLFAPYSKGEDAKILTITGNTVAAQTVISVTALSENIIPAMTSNTAPSGVASCSGFVTSDHAAWKAFDHVLLGSYPGWLSNTGGTGWLQYQYPAAHVITRYAISPLHDVGQPCTPKSWTFKGSNDGAAWTTLDTQTNVTDTDWAVWPFTRKTFDLANTRAYAYYRLDITASNQGFLGVGELEMPLEWAPSPHGILLGESQVVVIAGSNSTPPINGSYVATRVDDTHFSIPVNVTAAGTAGKVLYNRSVGWALTSGGCNDIGWLTQSPTTFHTGTMKKDFRYASVSHDVLPDGATVRPMSWLIDGVYGTAAGVVYGPQETRYPIDQQGYSIETTLGMTSDYTKTISPIVKGINVIWNFVKNKKHTYSLDCRSGANAGRWGENPGTALKFLYATANERATFEDRFAGVYQGAIESVEFTPAPISISEGPSGIAKIVVREDR